MQEENEVEGNEIIEWKYISQNILPEPNYTLVTSKELWLRDFQIQSVLELVAEWSTVPFIARYRKEATGDLDEDQIRGIIALREKIEKIWKAKNTAINTIDEMEKLTPELLASITNAITLKEVEDLYKPYKSKKKTKAMIAIEKGFQVVADIIKNPEVGYECIRTLQQLVATSEFQSLLKNNTQEEILEWSHEIIAAEIVADSEIRDFMRTHVQKKSIVTSKIKWEKMIEKLPENIKKDVHKFSIYSDFQIVISKIKPYQVLALNRWVNLKILWTKLVSDDLLDEFVRNFDNDMKTEIGELYLAAISSWYKTLYKSVENEVMWELSELWEDDAITAFQTNLGALLMTKPEYGKKALVFDPAYRTGCKIAILDEWANPVEFSKIFLHQEREAIEKIVTLIKKHKVDVVIVWNGTASNETVELVQRIIKSPLLTREGDRGWDYLQDNIFIVNESGASVYSASKVAQEEFKELDVTDRGTISIWRRFIDPLSELVKVPVGSIGVGMYQHDMPEKKLEEKLWYVVEDTVNEVWINVNTSSIYVLQHISWVDKRLAKKIYKNRPYNSRTDLKKVLSEKAYEQAIWFLRIPESTESFDNTDIHPEQYELAHYIIEHDVESISNVPGDIAQDFSQTTVDFILTSYRNIWKDPRVNSAHKKASKKIEASDIGEWSILEWTVRNVVAFGAFVDIGLKNDGLVHVSQIADAYVSDPNDFVSVGETVKVKVTGIDEKTGKIQLSMKDL